MQSFVANSNLSHYMYKTMANHDVLSKRSPYCNVDILYCLLIYQNLTIIVPNEKSQCFLLIVATVNYTLPAFLLRT